MGDSELGTTTAGTVQLDVPANAPSRKPTELTSSVSSGRDMRLIKAEAEATGRSPSEVRAEIQEERSRGLFRSRVTSKQSRHVYKRLNNFPDYWSSLKAAKSFILTREESMHVPDMGETEQVAQATQATDDDIAMAPVNAHATCISCFNLPAIYMLISLDAEDESAGKSGALLRLAHACRSDNELWDALDDHLGRPCGDLVPTVPPEVQTLVNAEGGTLLWKHVLLHGRGTLGETPLHLCFLGLTAQRRRLIRYMLTRFAQTPALQRHWAFDALDNAFSHKRHSTAGTEFVPYVDACYTAQPYHGEVCLHFACANKNFELVQLLVEAGADVLGPHASGKFFYSNAALYYGGSVLNVAACLGQTQIVDYLLESVVPSSKMERKVTAVRFQDPLKASPQVGRTGDWDDEPLAPDASGLTSEVSSAAPESLVGSDERTPSWQHRSSDRGPYLAGLHRRERERGMQLRGNSTLHCCVVHDQGKMLRHLVERWGADTRATNSANLSVLDYACLVGSPAMVRECLQLCSRLVWEWGPVQCKQYDVDDLFNSLTICIQHGRGELLELEQFHLMLNDMWESYGRTSYYGYFGFHVIECIAVVFLIPWWDCCAETRYNLFWLLIPGACWNLFADAYAVHKMNVWRPTMSSDGKVACNPRDWRWRDWHILPSTPHLLVDVFFSATCAVTLWLAIILHYVLANTDNEDQFHGIDAAFGVSACFAWLRCLNYLRMTKATGPFVISIGTIATEFVPKWGLVACIIFLAFTCLLGSLLTDEDGRSLDDSIWSKFFLAMFMAAIGEPDFVWLEGSARFFNSSAKVLYGTFTLVTSLLLVNLLIAMMSDCFTAIQKDARNTFRLAWGRGILVYTLLPMPFIFWFTSHGKRYRPSHHMEVDGYDARGKRWMMMLDELKESQSGDREPADVGQTLADVAAKATAASEAATTAASAAAATSREVAEMRTAQIRLEGMVAAALAASSGRSPQDEAVPTNLPGIGDTSPAAATSPRGFITVACSKPPAIAAPSTNAAALEVRPEDPPSSAAEPPTAKEPAVRPSAAEDPKADSTAEDPDADPVQMLSPRASFSNVPAL